MLCRCDTSASVVGLIGHMGRIGRISNCVAPGIVRPVFVVCPVREAPGAPCPGGCLRRERALGNRNRVVFLLERAVVVRGSRLEFAGAGIYHFEHRHHFLTFDF